MALKLTLAHISDVHLGPLPWGDALRNFRLKRLIGATSWHLKRKQHHRLEVSQAILSDIKAQAPDHVAFTGDLVNIAAWGEFERGAHWLQEFGPPQWISFVPGNHDAYVFVPWEKGLQAFAPYMQGEPAMQGPHRTPQLQQGFPYVRFLRNMAIIGLTTAEPQALTSAGGRLGPTQLASLEGILCDLRLKGYYRTILIHHPPLPGLSPARKALSDAALLQEVLAKQGAELILHGHIHEEMLNYAEGPEGPVPIIGVPSSSMAENGPSPVACWNSYGITRNNGRWQTDVTMRCWNDAEGKVIPLRHFTLSS